MEDLEFIKIPEEEVDNIISWWERLTKGIVVFLKIIGVIVALLLFILLSIFLLDTMFNNPGFIIAPALIIGIALINNKLNKIIKIIERE